MKRYSVVLSYRGYKIELYRISLAFPQWVAHSNDEDGHVANSALRALKGWYEVNVELA